MAIWQYVQRAGLGIALGAASTLGAQYGIGYVSRVSDSYLRRVAAEGAWQALVTMERLKFEAQMREQGFTVNPMVPATEVH